MADETEKVDIAYEIRESRGLVSNIDALLGMAASCHPKEERALKAKLDGVVSSYIDMAINKLIKIRDNL